MDIMHDGHDNDFKTIISGGWASETDGDVESSVGHFALILIEPNELAELNEACETNVPAGYYLASENSDGIIVVWKFDRPEEARYHFKMRAEQFAIWMRDRETPVFDDADLRMSCDGCGEEFDNIAIARSHEADDECLESAYHIVRS